MPNAIAVCATCFTHMHQADMDYHAIIEKLELQAKTKKGAGFAKTKKKEAPTQDPA